MIVLVPSLLVYLWRTGGHRGRILRQVMVAGILALAIALLLYARYWEGRGTFDGLRATAVLGQSGSAPWFVQQELIRPAGVPDRPIQLVAAAVVAVVGLTLAARATTALRMLRAMALTMIVHVFIASPSFWPWYPALAVALLVLVPDQRALSFVGAISVGSRLIAPIDHLSGRDVIGEHSAVLLSRLGGIAAPVVATVAFEAIVRRRERRLAASALAPNRMLTPAVQSWTDPCP
jgi:hypothetical protein